MILVYLVLFYVSGVIASLLSMLLGAYLEEAEMDMNSDGRFALLSWACFVMVLMYMGIGQFIIFGNKIVKNKKDKNNYNKETIADIRNKITPITTFISYVESEIKCDDEWFKKFSKEAKQSVNYLTKREVY